MSKKYSIITFGCQMNKSDSERIASLLENIGYQPASKINEANLIVVNMCSVRQSAVDRVHGLIPKFKKLRAQNPKIKTILTGCILKEDKRKFAKSFDLILSIKNLSKWPEYLRQKTVPLLWRSPLFGRNYFGIEPKYQNNFSVFVPISNGCNNFCSYCVVPFVRGSLVCRSHEEILKEVKNLIQRGFKEIWLLGQNVNDYQDKIKNQKGPYGVSSGAAKIKNTNQNSKIINFSKLIEMIDEIPGSFKFFFTSPHPKNFSDELIDTLAKCEKFGRYLNLPVQSGNDKILKKMNRNYSIKEYKNLVRKIREKIPEIKLSTDVIVGFPGETERQFQNTVKLFKETKFDYAYIAKYSPRPGTAAWQMKDVVPWQEKKKREKILREIINKKLSPYYCHGKNIATVKK